MKRIFYLVGLFFIGALSANIDHLLKPCLDKRCYSPIKQIDFIYVINLDERSEKWEHTINQLSPYGIDPYRFSAVNGWKIPIESLQDIGVSPKNRKNPRAIMGTFYPIEGEGQSVHELIEDPNKKYFSHCMSRGAIGIVLSHMSILKDFLESEYETVWIMEDDIEVIRSPILLDRYIEYMDKKVGKGNWDILFTDRDTKSNNNQYVPCRGYAHRPNFVPMNTNRFLQEKKIGNGVKKIGARYGAYSMIVRKSGAKKIYDFIKEYGVFLPYDMEFFLPENIQVYGLVEDVVSTKINSPSDNGCNNFANK